MSRSRPILVPASLALLAAAVLAGCVPPDDDDATDAGPCAETWGPAPAAGRIHVDAAAAEGGTGSASAPFATLDLGLAEARATGIRQIVMAPGDYPGSWALSNDNEARLDSGIEIAGCGREETLLFGIIEEEQVGDEMVYRLQPVLDIWGDTTAGIVVRDLGVTGGRRGIIVRQGAGATGPITIQRVDVLDSLRMGIVIDGATTAAHLLDVRVDGVEPEDGEFGWGIAVQTAMWMGGEFLEATVLQGVGVEGAQGLGILADGAWVEISDTTVAGVASVDGLLGRGVQLQRWTQGTLAGVTATGNHDAALFLEAPGRIDATGVVEPITVTDCVLTGTLAADVPDSPGETSGDGLVATQWYAVEAVAASEFLVVIDGSTLAPNERAEALAEAVTMEVGTDNVFGKGTDYPLAAQGGAIVQGIGGGEPGHEVVELEDEEALGLNRPPVELDDLGADLR